MSSGILTDKHPAHIVAHYVSNPTWQEQEAVNVVGYCCCKWDAAANGRWASTC